MIDTRVERQWARSQQTFYTYRGRPADPHLAAHAALCDELEDARAEIQRLTERLAAVTPAVTQTRAKAGAS